MCGIAGYHGLHADHALLERMNDCQQHRGPDGEGIVTSGPCGLAHRRLSIIDVAHGQQPMDTADGRYSIAYNGEVYNYLDLRDELVALGRTFSTDSDTEVVLQAFAQWGPDAFDRFNGMFGLAIWDREEKRLTLARDHFGIKPLYVAQVPAPNGDGEVLLFASEIKPILASGLYEKKVNERSVYRYLRFRAHEDGTETFFDGIERLAPGEMLTADGTGIQRRMFTRLKEELLELAHEQRPYDDAAAAEYKRRLVESVRLRLQSEVPVGTSLSGGLDSSAVAVIINQLLNEGDELSTRAVGTRQNTFSAVFPGSINDEERYVDDVLEDLHRPRRLAQDPADGRRVQGRPARLHPHPGGAAHLLRSLRAVPGDARGHPARHRAARRPGRRRDDGRLHPLLLRLPAPAARPGGHGRGRRAGQEPRRALPAGPLQAQGQGQAEEDDSRSPS